jgi:UDP-N-acetylmuramate dehydrogenase
MIVRSYTEENSLLARLPPTRGRLTVQAPLGQVGWFRTGGTAEILFKPADLEDLQEFLAQTPTDIPVTCLGVLSNVIVRDGGIAGVVIRLGREFAQIEKIKDDMKMRAGAAALDVNVATVAAEQNVANLEFLCGVPGTIGGALRMNAGAYGFEIKDVLIEAVCLTRNGQKEILTADHMGLTYRHCNVAEDRIFVEAVLQGRDDPSADIEKRMTDIREKRAATQPIKSQTGGSTFANPSDAELRQVGLPEGTKCWQLIDQVGGRGLQIGGAQMSEKHCNFMINTGSASAQDLEDLGEEIRRRVFEQTGISLRWEIKRLGQPSSHL